MDERRSPRGSGTGSAAFRIHLVLFILQVAFFLIFFPTYFQDLKIDRTTDSSTTSKDADAPTTLLSSTAATPPSSKSGDAGDYNHNNINNIKTEMTATGGGGSSSSSSSNAITKNKEVMKHKKENQFLVQVGANDGTRESALVYAMLKNDTTRAILVEGNPTVFKLLEQNIEKMYETAKGRIVPLNVLVCEDGKNMTFHMVDSHRIIKLFPDPPHWAIWQLSSLDRKSTAGGLRNYLSWKQNIPILKENNLTLDDFIIPKDIPCTSFANILKKGGFHNPRDVDVLSVDVEGYDGFVVLDALQTPNFKPNKIVFEVKVMKKLFPNVYVQVIEELHKNGYETGCNATETSQKFVCPPISDLTATLKN